MGDVIAISASARRRWLEHHSTSLAEEHEIVRFPAPVRQSPMLIDDSHIMRIDPSVYQNQAHTLPSSHGADTSLLDFYAPKATDHSLAHQQWLLERRRRGFLVRLIDLLKK